MQRVLMSRVGGRLAMPSLASRVTPLASVQPTFVQRRTLFEGWGVPQPPGNIVGTVNDPVKLPNPDAYHGSYHWDFERIVSVGLVPLAVLPLATGSLAPSLDALLGGLLIAHCQMGMNQVITDYFPPRKFPKGHWVCYGLLTSASLISLYGIYKLETEEEGLIGAVRQIWTA